MEPHSERVESDYPPTKIKTKGYKYPINKINKKKGKYMKGKSLTVWFVIVVCFFFISVFYSTMVTQDYKAMKIVNRNLVEEIEDNHKEITELNVKFYYNMGINKCNVRIEDDLGIVWDCPKSHFYEDVQYLRKKR